MHRPLCELDFRFRFPSTARGNLEGELRQKTLALEPIRERAHVQMRNRLGKVSQPVTRRYCRLRTAIRLERGHAENCGRKNTDHGRKASAGVIRNQRGGGESHAVSSQPRSCLAEKAGAGFGPDALPCVGDDPRGPEAAMSSCHRATIARRSSVKRSNRGSLRPVIPPE